MDPSAARQALDPALREALAAVDSDSDNLYAWEALVGSIETLVQPGSETSREVKQLARDSYDRLLARFPLLFGYWIKYVELERQFSGLPGGLRIYERAVAAFPASVDLWTQYGTFVSQTNEVSQSQARAIFKRGARLAGRDFLSHPFWDVYIAYEESIAPESRDVAEIIRQIIHYPMHQYARYYEKSIQLAQQHPDVFQDMDMAAVVAATQQGTNDRWAFESKITQSYFHVVELEQDQIDNWNEYLDFEESSGDFEQTRFLYERALIPAAFYDVFWLRYARWMSLFPDRVDETRNVFRRASTLFVPMSRPFVRFQWALFEESIQNSGFARDILAACQAHEVIDREEAYLERLHFERRQDIHGALAYIQDCGILKDARLRGLLNGFRALILWKELHDIAAARQHFGRKLSESLDSPFFLVNYFNFELSQMSVSHLHALWTTICSAAHIPPTLIEDISKTYQAFLLENGHMREYLEVDVETNGSFAVRKLAHNHLGDNTLRRLKLESGHPGVEIDAISLQIDKKNPFGRYLSQQENMAALDGL